MKAKKKTTKTPRSGSSNTTLVKFAREVIHKMTYCEEEPDVRDLYDVGYRLGIDFKRESEDT